MYFLCDVSFAVQYIYKKLTKLISGTHFRSDDDAKHAQEDPPNGQEKNFFDRFGAVGKHNSPCGWYRSKIKPAQDVRSDV